VRGRYDKTVYLDLDTTLARDWVLCGGTNGDLICRGAGGPGQGRLEPGSNDGDRLSRPLFTSSRAVQSTADHMAVVDLATAAGELPPASELIVRRVNLYTIGRGYLM
jgi:hypothetical protein